MSSPEVTITLGRSGQVVKRKRADLAPSLSYHSKRQRAIAVKENVDHDGENGLPLDRSDLRHKLIQKRLSSDSGTATRGNEQREKLKGEFSGASARLSISSNMLQLGPQCQRDRHFQRDPYRQATRDFFYMDSLRNISSTVTSNDLRQRSPARPACYSSCLSLPTYKPVMQKVTLGTQHAYSNSFPGPPRSTIPAHVMALTEPERTKPVALFPSSSCSMPRSSLMAEAPMTVVGLLNSLGVGKYAIHFQAEEVDMSALKQMGEKDLKDLGIPMGPRKKILQALSALPRRQLPGQR